MAKASPLDRNFWTNRRVLLTGHTGFKGAWAAAMLVELGASVTGVALEPEEAPNLWRLFDGRLPVSEFFCDIRNATKLNDICRAARPQVVIHMAAQAHVRRGFSHPVETYSTNVMGTVNLLEAVAVLDTVEVVLVVTSDKVYHNLSDGVPFKESDALGGSDPYSASKAAAEMIVRSYAESFFTSNARSLATTRGGNVLGGGDFSPDRLLPDLFRAMSAKRPVVLRYPNARRPWQHVLDCICGYLQYIEYLHGSRSSVPPSLNFGPPENTDMAVAQVAELFSQYLDHHMPWEVSSGENPPEKLVIRLDSSLARQVLGWSPRFSIDETVRSSAAWYRDYLQGEDPLKLVSREIKRYVADS